MVIRIKAVPTIGMPNKAIPVPKSKRANNITPATKLANPNVVL